MDARRARLTLVAWVALLIAVVTLLPRLAPHVSPPPLLAGLDAATAWWSGRDAITAVAGAVRVVVMAAAWYLLGSTVLAVAARVTRPSGWPALDALLLPYARRAVHGAFGIALSTAAFTTNPAVATPTSPSGGNSWSPAPPIASRAQGGSPAAATADDATWEVAPGESFWALAEHTLATSWGRSPTDREIDAYWRTVIEANRDRLADAGNPHLLFPGQLLRVPPPPASG